MSLPLWPVVDLGQEHADHVQRALETPPPSDPLEPKIHSAEGVLRRIRGDFREGLLAVDERPEVAERIVAKPLQVLTGVNRPLGQTIMELGADLLGLVDEPAQVVGRSQ